jgi:predicted DsbA family dithiol-disulfide isomerase
VTTPVRVWVDPSCPWAWQTVRWLLDLRGHGVVDLTWSLFSLEVNSSPAGTPFREAAPRHGASLAALMLARREQGPSAFEALYVALGNLLHERKLDPTDELMRTAADDAGMRDIAERAAARPDLGEAVIDEYVAARQLDVFGVPTLQLSDHKPVYGPIVANAPTDDDAMSLWNDVRGFAERDDLFELKRWPRDVRPGEPIRHDAAARP